VSTSTPPARVKAQATHLPEGIDPRLLSTGYGIRGMFVGSFRKIRGGDPGALPVVVGIVLIWVVFAMLAQNFLTADNYFLISRYIAYGGIMSLGLVMVLLLGEIDLSVGSMSGVASAIAVILTVSHHINWLLATVITVVICAGLGSFQGALFTYFRVPSFVVTLAGLLWLSGLQLFLLRNSGTINIPDANFMQKLDTLAYHGSVDYVLGALAVLGYILSAAFRRRQTMQAGLAAEAWSVIALKAAALAVGIGVALYALNRGQGLVLGFIILVVFLVAFSYMLKRTRYGQHVFAVGGNIEAARRAGINVNVIRISVFAIAGGMAALSGIVSASYVGSASLGAGGNTTLMYAIAAAVIGGTSLFGGRGTAWSALLGWLVLGSIQAGIFLLGLSAWAINVIVGGVLLVAAVVDALSRRRAAQRR
jgi:D-xylose transport system permease protein